MGQDKMKSCAGKTFHAASVGTRCASDGAQISRSTAGERAHRRTPSTSTQQAAVSQSAAQSHPLELALECSRRRGFHNRLRLTSNFGHKIQQSLAARGPHLLRLDLNLLRQRHHSSQCLQTVSSAFSCWPCQTSCECHPSWQASDLAAAAGMHSPTQPPAVKDMGSAQARVLIMHSPGRTNLARPADQMKKSAWKWVQNECVNYRQDTCRCW